MRLGLVLTLILLNLLAINCYANDNDAPVSTAGGRDYVATIGGNGSDVVPIQAIVYLDKTPSPVEAERAESSPSSPPLATDDPGTPGKNGWEINHISDCDHSSKGNACESGIDAALGIGERVQIRVSKSATLDQTNSNKGTAGYSATDIGVKWRFVDQGGLQVATFPSLNIDDASRIKNPDGTTATSDGHSIYIPILVSKDIGEKITVVANAGYRLNLNHADNNSAFTSVAVGRSFGENSRAMVEVASEGFKYSRRSDVRIGWIQVIFPDASSQYQTSVYASIGQSIGPTDDHEPHQTVLFGLTVTKKPD